MQILGRGRAKHLVRDLYRAILGREPDEEGARTYEGLLRRIGAERAVPKILRAFLRSAEYRKRADALVASHVNSTLASQGGDRLVNGQPIHHVVSLGSFCLPAILCQGNGLRTYSLPFDWIFSTPRMVLDCLADDFATFLDRRHYRSIADPKRDDPTREAAAEHDLYRERYGIAGLFAHRDPTRDSDYLYYVRCVTRFRQLLHSQDTKLFLIVGRAHHDLVNGFPLLLESLAGITTNFALLGVELIEPVEAGLSTLGPITTTGIHGLYRFTPSAFNPRGDFFPDKLDEWSLLRLIYRYKIALKDSPWSSDDSVEPLLPHEKVSYCQEAESTLPQ
jgi:hypothetical protein